MSVVGPRPLRPGEADTTADGVQLPLSAIPGTKPVTVCGRD